MTVRTVRFSTGFVPQKQPQRRVPPILEARKIVCYPENCEHVPQVELFPMRQFVKTILLSTCALIAFGGIALTAQQKVAIIDVQRAILETAEIKKAQADLEAKYKPRQDEFDAAQKEMAALQNQLDSQAASLTPAQGAELQGKLQMAQRRAQRMQEDLQASIGRDRDAILGQVGQRMQAVVTKIASAKDLDVLIDVSNAVYFKPALDITTEAVTAYDQAHPAS